jgi:DNA replication protein DnaC
VPEHVFEVPERFRTASIEGFDTSASPAAAGMAEAAWTFLRQSVGSLVMVGRPGAGKSHIAAAIVRAIRARDAEQYEQAVAAAEALPPEERRYPGPPPRPWWVPVGETMIRVRTFASDTEGLWLDVGEHPGLVVLDDLGRERISEFSGEQVYAALNMRYEARRRTIVTSNLSLAGLIEAGYGPILSRLSEDGPVLELVSAIDYRPRLRHRVAPDGGGTSPGAAADPSDAETAR